MNKINKPLDFRAPERSAERISTGIYIKIKAAFKKSSDFYIIEGEKIQILTFLEKSLKTLHSREAAFS